MFDITLPLTEAQFYAYRRTQKKLATGWAVVTIWTSLGENLIYIFTFLFSHIITVSLNDCVLTVSEVNPTSVFLNDGPRS